MYRPLADTVYFYFGVAAFAVYCYGMKPWYAQHPYQALLWATGLENGTLRDRLENPGTYITLTSVAWFYLYALAAYCVYYAYGLFFLPLNFIGQYLDPWTKTDSSKGRYKDPGGMPPPFPNGWFRALDTIDLYNGKVHSEMLFGKDLVFFRDYNGVVGILNLACAKCGTNLSSGKVVQDTIECSSCHCRFNHTDGKCSHSPSEDASKVPATRFWHVLEKNGHIYIWHDAENRPPSFLPPIPPEVNDGSCEYHGRAEHRITAHIAEMPENGPDVAHLNVLHKDFVISFLQNFFDHLWTGEWEPGKTAEDKQNAYVHVTQRVRWLGKHVVPGSFIDVRVTQCGLGLVCLKFYTPLGYLYVWETVTPVKPLIQKFHHLVWAEWKVPRIVGKGVLRALVTQAERDVPIWNHKTYLNKPVIVKGDGPIPHFRRWFKQFFSESSWSLAPDFAPLARLSEETEEEQQQAKKAVASSSATSTSSAPSVSQTLLSTVS